MVHVRITFHYIFQMNRDIGKEYVFPKASFVYNQKAYDDEAERGGVNINKMCLLNHLRLHQPTSGLKL